MSQLPLRRVIKGANKKMLAKAALLASGPIQVDTLEGKTLFGESDGTRFPVLVDGQEVGVVIGPDDCGPLVDLVAHMYAREVEKRALVAETLDRYKELTMIYETGEQLSRVIDVADVAQVAVEQAKRSLAATSVTLHLVGAHDKELTTIAQIGELGADPENKDSIESRVLETGNSEFVESETTSVMCAPLRSGDRVFGLLRVTNASDSQWTAGDLKLVTSIAANAASAVSHAHLHQEQLMRQVIRNQVERHVSPNLLAALGDNPDATAVVIFADLAMSSSTQDHDAAKVVERMHTVRAHVMDEFMQHGAVLNVTPNDMVVAVFVDAMVQASCAQAFDAVRAASARVGEHASASQAPVGFGLAMAPLRDDEFLAGIGAAATLQSKSEGRILMTTDFLDYIEASTAEGLKNTGDYLELPK